MAVVSMKDIKAKKKESIEWKFVGYDKEMNEFPLKIWENLECVLEKHNIKVRMNDINHEIEYEGLKGSNLRNGKLTDVYSLQIREGLKMTRDEVANSILRIAEENLYNPFLDIITQNKSNDTDIIEDVFNCLEIQEEYKHNVDYYSSIFVKWCLNVVKMAHNTLENDFSSQGVLVLQGGQGCFKSTFSRLLMPNKDWFKGDKSLDPEKVDSIMQNTSYILVEWGELDSTVKGEQAKLKQYITATADEYRAPYSRLAEKYPRKTSYIGTVNKKDFLKDETGSRRFWIIPIQKCNVDKLENIDMAKFWGAVLGLWESKTIQDFLSVEEQNTLNKLNKEFNYETDITIVLNENLSWESPEEGWEIYNVTEICEKLYIKEKKALKAEMEKRGIEYKTYRANGRTKKGYKIPSIY